MKKVLVLLLTLTLTLSMSLSALGASDKSNNGKGKGANKSEIQTAASSDKAKMKQFKQEMNQYVKDPVGALQGDLDALNASKTSLEKQISDATLALAALTPGTPEYEAAQDDLDAKSASLATLDGQIAVVNAKISMDPESLKKQFINERFMVIKSEKSEFDLSLYDNAQALIAAMYTAAEDPGAWTLWTNKSENLLKLEGPLYLKGSKIMFPLAAMRDLGAVVTWDETTKTVTVVGANGISVVFSPEGKAATTQASVAGGAIEITDGIVPVPGEKTGTVTGQLTDPVTGLVYDVKASATLGLEVDPADAALFTDNIIPTTITADIVDPAYPDVVIKTVELEVSGTITSPSLSFEDVTLDVAIADTTVMNCGRAYHPLNDLAEVFGLEVTADVDEGVVEVAPAEEVPEEAAQEV